MFSQGTFINDPNATPSELERKREAIRAMLGQYGKARYVGEGIADMFTGIANGIGSARMNKQEREAREQATNQYEDVLGGWNPFGGNISTSGATSSNPNATRNAAMAANGGPTNAAAAQMGGLPSSLVQSESGGNWRALNSEGYGGRGQFGAARLADAARAGIIPPGMTGAQYSQQPESVQLAVENWHKQDILGDLGKYVGVDVDGPGPIPPLTEDSILSVAHLGGTGGARKFIESGGRYNPSDSNGTSLADYASRHAGGGTVSTQGSAGGAYPAYTGPAVQDLAQLMANPWLTPEQRSVVAMQLQQAQQASDPMRQIQWQQAQQQMALNDEKLRQMRQPAPGYRQVTGAELGLSGDQASALFNVGPDGKVSQIGGGGTNVSIDMGNGTPGLGKLSTDYGYVMNPDGTPRIDPHTGLPQAAAVPGSPAAQESAQREQQAGMRQEQAGRAANIVMQDINRALEQSDQWGTTGAIGGLFDGFGGTAAHDLQNTLRTVQANIGFDRLQQMREASPTGGALGAVSERELTELQAVLGSIQQTQSRDQLQRNLTRLRDVYSNILRKASAYPNAEDFGFGAQPESDELPAAAPDYLTDQDKELWEIMTPEERRAVLGSY